MKNWFTAAAVFTLLFTSFVHADVDYNLVIGGHPAISEYSVGSGANTSYLVVDFANSGGSGPDNSYLFAYHYTGGSTTSEQMLNAIAGAVVTDPLHFTGDYFGTSLFVSDFTYKNETNDPLSNAFWRFALGSVVPDPQNNSLNTVSWADSFVGASDRILSNNSIDGWIYVQYDPQTFEYLGNQQVDPRIPTALPEPSTIYMLIGAPLWLLRRRKVR